MLIVISVPTTAALAVVAYTHVRRRAPEAAEAGLRAVRELAAIIGVLTKAVEAVVYVLAGPHRIQPAASPAWGHSTYEPDYDEQDET